MQVGGLLLGHAGLTYVRKYVLALVHLAITTYIRLAIHDALHPGAHASRLWVSAQLKAY